MVLFLIFVSALVFFSAYQMGYNPEGKVKSAARYVRDKLYSYFGDDKPGQ